MHVQHTLEAKIVVQLGRGVRLNIVDHRHTGKADDITHPASRTQPLSNLSPSFHVQDLGCAICSTEVQLQLFFAHVNFDVVNLPFVLLM